MEAIQPTETTLTTYRQLQREYYAGIFDFIIEHEQTLRGILRNCCRKQFHLLDELWSDVVLECVPRAFRTYDPNKGELLIHVYHTVEWYVTKWFTKQFARVEREPLLSDFSLGGYSHRDYNARVRDECIDQRLGSVADRETVQTILGKLNEYDRTLLHLHYVLGWTYVAIAEHIGCAEKTIRTQCDNAIWNAKKIADRMQDA